MFKRVKKITPVLMGAVSIVSLIQKGIPKKPSKFNPSTSITVKTGEIRVGGDKEGIILLGIGSGTILTR